MENICDLDEKGFIFQLNNGEMVCKDVILGYLLFKELKYIYFLNNNSLKSLNPEIIHKTNISIEFDMRNSALTLMGLISRDLACVKVSFLNKNTDIYSVFCLEYERFFNSPEGRDLLSSLPLKLQDYLIQQFTSRELIKYFVMCFIYSEKILGRLHSCWKKINNDLIMNYCNSSSINSKNFNKILFLLCQKLDHFFNNLFPQMVNFINQVLEIVKLIIQINDIISFKTMCGSLIQYNYLKSTDSQIINFFDYNLNYRSKQRVYSMSDQTDISKHLSAFWPNFIHSVDAFFMREISKELYINKKYVIEPLHDSIRIHPNLISDARDIISNVYYNNQLGKSFLLASLIEPNIKSMSEDDKQEVLNKFDKLSFGSFDYGTKEEFLILSRDLFSF
jgi:hypothetical protein